MLLSVFRCVTVQPLVGLVLLLCLLPVGVASAQTFDLVVNNGRVLDPESGLDAVRHIGIRGDEIISVSPHPLVGKTLIDATGLAVAPGFIDLHTHSPTPLGQHYQLFDGVTTALELEAGHHPVATYGGKIAAASLSNYGAASGYVPMRLLVKSGLSAANVPDTPSPVGLKGWWTALRVLVQGQSTALHPTFAEQASAEELQQLERLLRADLEAGALGVGLALDYISEAVGPDELQMIFRVAAEYSAPVFVHVRRGINGDPAGLREILAVAGRNDAAVHICHLSHNGMRNTAQFIEEIRAASLRGVDVTFEVLPYNAGSALISSAVFKRDWQTVFGISYADVEWAETGERLTKETFEQYQTEQPDGAVIHHYLQEEWTREALLAPEAIVVSDLLPMLSKDINVAPHNGAFSKVLGRYVRQEKALSLLSALRKMTLLPAKRMQAIAPVFLRKGRLQQGMIADITIFDPALIIDRATYQSPYQESTGVEYVIVNGVPVIDQGQLRESVYPGVRLTAQQR